MDGVNRRRRLKPFDERRIGWIRSLPNYKILCCGNSATDLSILLGEMLICSIDCVLNDSLICL